ncbi:MAG: acyl-CoA thioesterase [Lentimicrobiaceae bacterium]|nr:acyl-CoA thioesterase [Lentimicrobiaceae bacterium]
MKTDYIYELKMKVRDYECDSQGIVNNANYQHYTEHTRHEFLESRGIKFSTLQEQGIVPVVARIVLEYKTSLKGGDMFYSRLNVKKEGIRYIFQQDIYRAEDEKLCVKAVVECVCIVNGRLKTHEIFDKILIPNS